MRTFRIPRGYGKLTAAALSVELCAQRDNENGILFASQTSHLFGLRLTWFMRHEPTTPDQESISLWFTTGLLSRGRALRELYRWARNADPTTNETRAWMAENLLRESSPLTAVGNTALVQLTFVSQDGVDIRFTDAPPKPKRKLPE